MKSSAKILLSLVMLFALGAATGCTLGHLLTKSYFEQLIDKQKIQAANQLAAETEKVLVAERKQKELSDALEKQYDSTKTQIQTEQATNRRLASELSGLRDKGRRASRCPAVPATGSTTVNAVTETDGAYLSDEASEFLLGFAYDADQVAAYAQTCHEWVMQRQATAVGK